MASSAISESCPHITTFFLTKLSLRGVKPKGLRGGKEALLCEIGAKEFGKYFLRGDDVDDAIKREVDAQNVPGDEDIEWTDGKLDDSGDLVQSEF